jgi:hypothetical protein
MGATSLGIMTFSVTTLSIKGLFVTFRTFSITALSLKTLGHYAECHVLFIVMLNVVMISVIMIRVVILVHIMPGEMVPLLRTH